MSNWHKGRQSGGNASCEEKFKNKLKISGAHFFLTNAVINLY